MFRYRATRGFSTTADILADVKQLQNNGFLSHHACVTGLDKEYFF